MDYAVKRITSAFSSDGSFNDLHASAVRTSFILSVDQAHAVHPNYCNKHEKNHGPKMNAGVTIKTNQNQRCKWMFSNSVKWWCDYHSHYVLCCCSLKMLLMVLLVSSRERLRRRQLTVYLCKSLSLDPIVPVVQQLDQ